ncbi:sortase [Candidatus Dojkabacteria bacterium]|nr:sortase [Candidatus Dojkabacteria bacterium]
MQKKYLKHKAIRLLPFLAIILPITYVICFAFLSFAPLLYPNAAKQIQEKYEKVIAEAKKSDTHLLAISPEELLKTENTLVIPILGIEMPISDEDANIALHNGIWHDGRSSTPLLSGNTVLSGHRYYYSWLGGALNRANYSLYHLDNLEQGDLILLIWDHKIYRYFVTEISEIDTNDLELLQETENAQITLYTCTPLPVTNYTKRLVVIAK